MVCVFFPLLWSDLTQIYFRFPLKEFALKKWAGAYWFWGLGRHLWSLIGLLCRDPRGSLTLFAKPADNSALCRTWQVKYLPLILLIIFCLYVLMVLCFLLTYLLLSFVYFLLFLLSFWPHLWCVRVPGPGIRPVPQQWQCWVVYRLYHQGTLASFLIRSILFFLQLLQFYSFIFLPHLRHVGLPGPWIEPVPQQWQHWILNPLSHKGTLPVLFSNICM